MQLSEFKKVLAAHAGQNLAFLLPTGTKVPAQVHVTEVARVDKRFVDCGGTLRTEASARLQTWFDDDTEHRLSAGKLLKILEKAADLLGSETLPMEVEHEAPFLSIFPVESVASEEGKLVIRLGIRHTDCLAKGYCLPPPKAAPGLFTPLASLTPSKCC